MRSLCLLGIELVKACNLIVYQNTPKNPVQGVPLRFIYPIKLRAPPSCHFLIACKECISFATDILLLSGILVPVVANRIYSG
jgi:hypothetical protein